MSPRITIYTKQFLTTQAAKKMLSQMTDKIYVRLDGRSIDIEHLDITSYLSSPSHINNCNEHVGTVYCIFFYLSDMGWLGKYTAMYIIQAHVWIILCKPLILKQGK